MTLALGTLIILVLIFFAGLSLGVVFTLIAVSGRRTIADQPPYDPQLVRDSSNPYEPSSVGVSRASRSMNGCAITMAVFTLVVIGLLSLAATIFYARISTVKTGPPVLVPATPLPVVQPQPPPANHGVASSPL